MTGTEVCQATNWIRGKGHRVKREGGVNKVHVPATLLSSVSSLYTGLRRCHRYGGMSSLPRSWDIAAIHFSTHRHYRKFFIKYSAHGQVQHVHGWYLVGLLRRMASLHPRYPAYLLNQPQEVPRLCCPGNGYGDIFHLPSLLIAYTLTCSCGLGIVMTMVAIWTETSDLG